MAFIIWFYFLSFTLYLVPCGAQNTFRLANIYSNEMVLQMAPKSAHIWGWGNVGATITIQLGSILEYTTVASDGKWSVRLPPQMAGGPYEIILKHSSSDVISINVWFGDIWVCSGQSNIEMQIRQILNSTEETEKAITYQNLRLLQVGKALADVELEELDNIYIPWSIPNAENIPYFSALCVMFGERISDSLKGRPIGLIDTTWGGTHIEAWSSTRVSNYCNAPPNHGSGDPNFDNTLWNGMIKPLTNMAVRGSIWYQGESNADFNPEYYGCHIQRLAEDWKNTFIDGTVNVPEENNIAFPFGIVQIGPTSGLADFGTIRWHQTVDTGVQPNVFMPEAFMAASYDTTDYDSPTGTAHPRDKQTVADRLANAGKALLYGENLHLNGPVVVGVAETSSEVLTLTYDMDITVTATNGFTLRRNDGTWVETTIESSSGRDVHVNIESGATHLAYAWTGVVCEYKMCSIYSADAEVVPAQVWIWNLALNKHGL